MKRGAIAGIALLLVLVPGCAMMRENNPVLHPPTGPGTDYPCGYTGVSCFPVDGTHTCCWHNSSCKRHGDDLFCEQNQYDPNDPRFLAGKKERPRFSEGAPPSR